jgi:MFS family permease
LGTIGSIAEAFAIILEFFIGLIFDLFGRKKPLIFGFLLFGIGLIGIPFFKKVFPWFLILRIMISLGAVFGMSVPLLPDYV